MGRSTNALFWIICGAIFVVTVYIIVNSDLSNVISEIFTDTNNIVDKADDGSTPGKPAYVSAKVESDEFSITFKKSANSTRYRCNYGTEKGSMKETGVIYIDKDTIVCSATHLKPNTKYYVQLLGQNLDKETGSDIKTVTTSS